MILIMLGPPGAGKGTEAEKIMKKYSIPQISTGDMLRNEIKTCSPLGKKAKAIMDKGELLPDEIMIDIIKSRISKKDCRDGFILDGFPRTIKQADDLEILLKSVERKLDAVINFTIKDNQIIERISTRRFCIKCSTTYNVITNPPQRKGICDACCGELIQRDDDKEETVRNRLEVYKQKTQPLIDYYKKHKLLIDVDANKDIETVNNAVMKEIRRFE